MTFNITIERDSRIDELSRSETMKALQERSEALHKVLEEAGEDMDPSKVKFEEFKDGQAMATWVRNINGELTKIGKRKSVFDEADAAKRLADEADAWVKTQGELEKPGHNFAPGAGEDPEKSKPAKTLGQAFVESAAYVHAKSKNPQQAFALEDVDAKQMLEQKTTMTTSAGWAPESTRIGRLILDAQRPVEVTDFIPTFPTSQAAVVFMEETTFTNAAAERAEEAAYAESALALTEQSSTVRSIGTRLPVTDEQLDDEDQVRAYIDLRLMFMVRQRLDSQILVGNGTPPNLEGTLNVTGIGSQAKGADSVPDAIYKGIDLVRVTGRAIPNVSFIHPNDWQGMRLLKTTDGIYIWGSPSDAGPERIWGLPVVVTTAVTENTAIVGDYARMAGLFVRRGMDLQVGYVNDDFADGRVTIRAGIRVALVHFRPAAFAEITGI